jgi:hypothetical protein
MKTFPHVLEIDHMTVSLPNGGGRHEETYVTQDDHETVIAWYDEHYSHLRVTDEDRATWQGPGWANMIIEVTVEPLRPAQMPLLSRLESAVQLLQRTLIQVTHHRPPRRWRWFGWWRT